MGRLVLVAVVLSACTATHGAGPGGDDTNDAGTGSDGGGGSDSGGDDGTIAPTDVRVFVHDGFAPIANVRVVFDGADGTRTELTTDATGTATATMATGGDVTAIRTYPVAAAQKFPEVYNWLGVKPGEQLHVGHVVDGITTPTTINVLVPAVAQGTVKVVTPCGSGQGRAPSVAVLGRRVPAERQRLCPMLAGGLRREYAVRDDRRSQQRDPLRRALSTTLLAYDVTPDLSSVTVEGRAVAGTHSLYSTGEARRSAVDADQHGGSRRRDRRARDRDRRRDRGWNQMIATRTRYEPMPVSVDASGDLIPYLQHARPTRRPASRGSSTAPARSTPCSPRSRSRAAIPARHRQTRSTRARSSRRTPG